mgnify:CR=1 FL=1
MFYNNIITALFDDRPTCDQWTLKHENMENKKVSLLPSGKDKDLTCKRKRGKDQKIKDEEKREEAIHSGVSMMTKSIGFHHYCSYSPIYCLKVLGCYLNGE